MGEGQKFIEHCLVEPGAHVDLSRHDPSDHSLFKGGKDKAKDVLKDLTDEFGELQTLLYAERKQRILIVFQAMDTGGKDGVVRHVFRGISPAGVRVANFKQPSPEERSHDFLWRVHQQVPGNGEIVIFNRSHYEDVLIVRVHELVSEEIWKKRYGHINDFERMLSDEGTTIVKFFLHISKEEQKGRLEDRLDDPDKYWKFSEGDVAERKLWGRYMEAYEAVLSRTSSKRAPWYLIPADHKWYRNLAVSHILIETLAGLKMQYPKATFNPEKIAIK